MKARYIHNFNNIEIFLMKIKRRNVVDKCMEC